MTQNLNTVSLRLFPPSLPLQGRGNNHSSSTDDNGDDRLTVGSKCRRQRLPQPTARQTLESLAACSAARGRMHEAKALWKRAVALRKVRFDLDNTCGEADEIELPFWLVPVGETHAREEDSDAHRPQSPTVEKLDLLGKRALDEGRTDDALELLRRALEIRQKEVGKKEHPELAKTLYYLGRCELDEGRLDEAERLENRALRIQEKELDDDHPDLVATREVKEEIKRKREFFFR